ncbi:MAG: MFS transporter [Acetobacteraceae bacterium]
MRLSYGWVIIAAGMAMSCIGMGAMMSLGVLLQPIVQDTGWSRTAVSTAALLNFLGMGVGSFIWGALSDRFGARIVVLAGGLMLGLGLALAGRMESVLAFQAVYGGTVGLAVGSLYVPMTALAVRWFDRNRSLAAALVSIGMGMGTTIMAPLAGWLVGQGGWRYAMTTMGLIAWAVILPASLLLRPPPAVTHAGAAVHQADMPDMALWRALLTPQCLAISLAFFACCAAHSGPIFHMVSYVANCGVPEMAAASVFGVAGLGGLFGRIAFGLLSDRFGARPTLIAGLTLQGSSILLWLADGGLGGFYATALVFGFAYGGVMPLYAILVRESFPGRIMGGVFGVVVMVSFFGMAVGPWLGGVVFDTFGTYAWLYLVSAALGLVAAGIACMVRPNGGRLVPQAA